MKKYGIILADNGSAWFISGMPDPRWNDSNLQMFSQLLGSNFEAVDATVLEIDPNSGAARQSGVTVTVTPASASVRVGHFQAFSATVSGATGGVTWSVNDVPGGNTSVGTIDANGQYLPPSSVPTPNVVTVRAISVSTPSASGTASVTILPPPSITSLSPSQLTTGNFTLTVNGAGFNQGSTVSFDGVALATTFVSSTQVTATGNAPAPKTAVPVFVTTADGDASNLASIDVVAAPVTIAISPTSVTLRRNQTRQFAATVSGTLNTSVIWRVNGVTGGNASVGTITTSGFYKAPAAIPSGGQVTVSASSVADPTKSASAIVKIRK
jgi:hypothetical protein